jgi:hypothetical protein
MAEPPVESRCADPAARATHILLRRGVESPFMLVPSRIAKLRSFQLFDIVGNDWLHSRRPNFDAPRLLGVPGL